MKKFVYTIVLMALTMSIPTLVYAAKDSKEKNEKKEFSIWKYLDKKPNVYLFSYFEGNGDGLHLCYSYDGLVWKTIRQGEVLLKPEVGEAKLMRDPSIVQGPDGTFHMVWTSGWTENNIGYASSKDLIHWSQQQEIPVMKHEPTVRNTWAPELFYNKSNKTYYIIWASTIPDRFPMSGKAEDDYNHRLYYTTTKDFQTYSETKLFYDPEFNVIDATILKEKCTYYMFLKNETREPEEKNIRMVASKHLLKFPKEVSNPFTGKEWAEGPTAIRIGKYVYVYWDKYRNHRYGAVRTKNLKKAAWEDISNMVKFPQGVRHGTAFEVDESILRELLKETE